MKLELFWNKLVYYLYDTSKELDMDGILKLTGCKTIVSTDGGVRFFKIYGYEYLKETNNNTNGSLVFNKQDMNTLINYNDFAIYPDEVEIDLSKIEIIVDEINHSNFSVFYQNKSIFSTMFVSRLVSTDYIQFKVFDSVLNLVM